MNIIMATCEMCGSVVNSTTTIKVAGTNMQACEKCKHLGKPVERSPDADYSHTFRKSKKMKSTVEVVSNFNSILSKALAKKGMSIKQLAMALNIKESTLNQYASGKIKPDIGTAQKIERFLEVSITEEVGETDPAEFMSDESLGSGDEGLSLGDMLLKKMQSKK